MKTIQQSIPDFNTQIALECDALDKVFAQELFNYHQTPLSQNKSWFAIGLESNDRDVEKDNSMKSGVIKRMIDAIINFIKRMIDRISSFFKRRKEDKQESNKEFADNYKKQLQNTPETGNTPENKKNEETSNNNSENSDGIKIVERIGEEDTVVLYTMLDQHFNKDFNRLANKAHGFLSLKHMGKSDILHAAAIAKNIRISCEDCLNDIKESVKVPVDKRKEKLAKIFSDRNQTFDKLLKDYDGLDLMLKHSDRFLVQLLQAIEELKKEVHDSENAENVKIFKELAVDVSNFINLFLQVDNAYRTLMRVL